MKTLPTNQGTATSETALCVRCENLSNICYARSRAMKIDDIDPNGEFVDCSENKAITCCICGEQDR